MLQFSKEQRYSVYWIGKNSQLDMKTEGYIGFSQNAEKRIRSHVINAVRKNKKTPLYEAIRKEGLKNFSYLIVESGLDELSAYNLEFSLRPHERIGYNRTPGGHIISRVLCCPLSVKDNLKLEKQIDKTEKYIKSQNINLYKWLYKRW